jgi:hypothetical protein
VDTVGKVLQIAPSKGTLFSLLRQEDQEYIPVLFVDCHEVILSGFLASHLDDEIRKETKDVFVNLTSVVMLYRRQPGSVDVQKRKRLVLRQHLPNLIEFLTIGRDLRCFGDADRWDLSIVRNDWLVGIVRRPWKKGSDDLGPRLEGGLFRGVVGHTGRVVDRFQP